MPLSQSTYYILLSLREQRHGYSIMQDVETISRGAVQLGPGTLYGALSKLEKQGVIRQCGEQERRKYYELTALGVAIVKEEFKRLGALVQNGREIVEKLEG